MAVLWNNRANALYQLQRWADALASSENSMHISPTYDKVSFSGLPTCLGCIQKLDINSVEYTPNKKEAEM